MTKVKSIVNFLLNKYPLSLASNFDQGKVGLQFGSMEKNVKKVMITLDASTEVVKEALENNVDMIISHHPFMFNSLISLHYDNPLQEKIQLVIKNDLNVFAMHTNFDVAFEGMNEILGTKLGLKDLYNPLKEISTESFLRIGYLEENSLENLIVLIKDVFKLDHLRYVGSLNKKIQKVGIVGGSGGSFLSLANLHQCDLFITGEIKHNNALDAIDLGITLIEVPHAIERFYKEYILEILQQQFPEVLFILAKKDQDPLKIA